MADDIIEEIKEETLNVEDESNNSANKDVSNDESQRVEDTKEVEESETKKQKKVPFLNKILFGLVGFLLLILIVGAILFSMGFFDAVEEPKKKDIITQEQVVKEESRFNINDINSKKLNKQLLLLTNKNILLEEENNKREKLEEEKKIKLEEEKKKKEALDLEEKKISKEKEDLENKKAELEKQKNELEILKNEAIALRNEMINSKNLLEMKKEELIKTEAIPDEVITKKENINIEEKENIIKEESKFVSLINVAKIKGDLYKSYLDKITAINSDIKLCRDELNRIEIYYGPFEDNTLRNDLYKKLQKMGIKNSYEVELTKEEFDKRCNY
tara:strand:+ start:2816 stop:3805 length:990 start_codon:yes stop_codon:yes gene_type:complete